MAVLSERILLKGTGEGLSLNLCENFTVEENLELISDKLMGAAKFFGEGQADITVTGKELSEIERAAVENRIYSAVGDGVNVLFAGQKERVVSGDEEDEEAGGTDEESFENAETETDGVDGADEKTGEDGTAETDKAENCNEPCRDYFRGTVRLGQEVFSENGSLSVLGDVNPGGFVSAKGSVFVFGSLRGRVFAGTGGDSSAVVAALDMRPMQLAVAGVVARAPDGGEEKREGAEYAYLEDGAIHIKKLKKEEMVL